MAENKKVKRLNKTELNRELKKLDERDSFTVFANTGSAFEVSHDIKFRKSKQHQLINDMVKFFGESNKNHDLLELATPYITLLLIKHFTDVNVEDEIDEALLTMTALTDLNLLGPIVNELPQEEVTKVHDLVKEVINNFEEDLKNSEVEAKEVLEKIENPEVKDMIENNG